jgi:hypothetical protein
MKILNTYESPLGLPNGQVIESKASDVVADWENIKSHNLIQAWLAAGFLVEEPEASDAPKAPTAPTKTPAASGDK